MVSPTIGAGVVDQEGRIIPSNTFPPGIAKATAELALFLLRYDITAPAVRRAVFSVRSERIGESSSTYDSSGSNETLPPMVMELIEPFLVSGAGYSSRLVFRFDPRSGSRNHTTALVSHHARRKWISTLPEDEVNNVLQAE